MLSSAHHLTYILPTVAIVLICQSILVTTVKTSKKHNSTMVKGQPLDVSYQIPGAKGKTQPCGNNCSRTIDSLPAEYGERGTAILEGEVPLKESGACVIQGSVNEKHNWYGYLAELKLVPEGGKVYFKFNYPKASCCLKMLIYLTEQYNHLRKPMNCVQKQAVLDPKSAQVITLSPSSKHSGCNTVTNEEGIAMLECKSGRILKSDSVRTWYIAASNCGSPNGLHFDYSLIVFGNLGQCPQSQSSLANNLQHHSVFMYITFMLIASQVL